MSAIDLLLNNLDVANRFPQIIDQTVGASVEKVNFLANAYFFAVLKNLTSEELNRLQNGENIDSVLRRIEIEKEIEKIEAENFVPGQRTQISDTAISAINALDIIKETQRALTYQSLSFICTSFEAYCKDRFFELTGKDAPRNIVKISSVFEVFARDGKCLDVTLIPDSNALEVTLNAQGVDVQEIKKCFSYRHVIVHRAGLLDSKAVAEIGFDNSYIGKYIEQLTLSDIQSFSRAFNYLAYWIQSNAVTPI